MSVAEHLHTNPQVYIPIGMESIRFPFDQASDIAITMGDSTHPRFALSRLIEHDTFVALHDRPEEFPTPEMDEFLPYDNVSAFTYAELVPRTDHSDTLPRLMGMNRFVPFTPNLGIKTVTDLATIPTSTGDQQTKEQIIEALLHKGAADCTAEEIAPKALEKVIMDILCRTNGSCDPNNMIDVATLAPDMHLPEEQKIHVVNALLGATTIFLLRANKDLQQTGRGFETFLQFTDRAFAGYMRRNGYPSEPIAGLRKVYYDTDGAGIAMNANPLTTNISELRSTVKESDPTSHLGQIASIYRQHFDEEL